MLNVNQQSRRFREVRRPKHYLTKALTCTDVTGEDLCRSPTEYVEGLCARNLGTCAAMLMHECFDM